MYTIASLLGKIPEIEKKLAYHFRNSHLLVVAFCHRSFVNEEKGVEEHNERLEFLGDSILGLLISDYLYRNLPTRTEGDLSYLRSRLVEASSCAVYIEKLALEQYLLLSRGERMNQGRGRNSILADLFEAIVGAIYLDGGIEAASHFIFGNFEKEILEILETPERNWKALLQDWCQKKYHKPPTYQVISETGPDHRKNFNVMVSIDDAEMGVGEGPSKKEAQQAAAAQALTKIDENHES